MNERAVAQGDPDPQDSRLRNRPSAGVGRQLRGTEGESGGHCDKERGVPRVLRYLFTDCFDNIN